VGYSLPLANVSIVIDWRANGSLLFLIGVFGQYDTLTITFRRRMTRSVRHDRRPHRSRAF
jgi:hypothetical protein